MIVYDERPPDLVTDPNFFLTCSTLTSPTPDKPEVQAERFQGPLAPCHAELQLWNIRVRKQEKSWEASELCV